MSSIISENFLLQSKTAKKLYHEYIASIPIIDYHCHLPPSDIAKNKHFENLTKLWLNNDHYKWRAMRTLGINEKFITGKATDEEKFKKWAQTVPYTVGNPLYHWTHMELHKYFGIDELLDSNNAKKIYDSCSGKLRKDSFSTQSLIKKMNVETICTTDDPIDGLEHHKNISQQEFGTKVLPTFRPDKAYSFENVENYNRYISKLEKVSDTTINTFNDLLRVLAKRIQYFHNRGCRLSDHGLEKIYYAEISKTELDKAYKQIRNGKTIKETQRKGLSYYILLELSKMYENKGWVQQFHLGALRNTNDRMKQKLGTDAGFDSIGDFNQAQTLAQFLNELDSTNQLTKTILYNLNPSDNEIFATMIGNFNDGSVKGKMQYGSAWWFLDQKNGIEKQLTALSNMGLLSCYVGMLTDSRSFLSYPRHEYFRRILCNFIGKDIEKGLLPDDLEWFGKIVSDICYNNSKEYFNF